MSESIFSLGNEYMGVRGYFEEGYSGSGMLGSYLNGVFEEDDIHHPFTFKGMATRMTFLVNAVDWLHTRITLDGETLDLARGKISGFTRRLDLRAGTLCREFRSARGRKEAQSAVPPLPQHGRAATGRAADRLPAAELLRPGRSRVGLGLRRPAILGQRQSLADAAAGADGRDVAILAATKRSGHRVFSAFSLRAETPLDARLVEREQFIGEQFTLDLRQGVARSFDKLVVNHGERDATVDDAAVWSDGLAHAGDAFAATFDAALADHAAYWEHVWRTIDVRIEGDAENEQGIRYCIFQLHQTYHGVDPRLNISAKGLTGESYWGATWWDTETYCLPFYIFNNPQAARNLLGYRHATLPGACSAPSSSIASACAIRWRPSTAPRSSACGSTATWRSTSVPRSPTAFGITRTRPATRNFSTAAASRCFWRSPAITPAAASTAPRRASSASWFVMGADEFHMGVHNNAYTNVMAKKCFRMGPRCGGRDAEAGAEAVAAGRQEDQADGGGIARLAAEGPRHARSAGPAHGPIEQHDGYFDMPHLDLAKVPPTDFPLYHHWAYVRIFRWDMTKQPDALLLPFFFSHEYSEKVKRINFKYYEPRCSHESSLSPGVFSILAAELGLHEKAYDYSLHAARLDLDDYNRNTHEGLHTTSMAAAWLLLVYGFGGLRSDGPLLAFRPSLPRKWKSYSFRILHRGSVLGLTVDKKSVAFQIYDGPDLEIEVFGKRRSVDRDALTLPLPANRRG